MIIPFEELAQHDFALSGIHAICQKPTYQQMNLTRRRCNGFIYVTQGQCRYTFRDQTFTLNPGALAYLPQGSRHLLEILSPQTEFFRIDFTVHIGTEQVLFSREPAHLTDAVPPECDRQIRLLEEGCRLEKNTVARMAALCQVLEQLHKAVVKPYPEKLLPAIRYLQQHMSEQLNCHYLASLCYVSTTRFYALFRREVGMTPLQYRDKLLLDRAVVLLRSGDIGINEVAQILGFGDPAYFSRFFKKHMGCSPKQFGLEGQVKT